MSPVDYLSEKEFCEKYQLGDEIHRGSSGRVHTCHNHSSLLIKIQEGDFSNLETFFNELTYYSIVNHPNILQPVHWSLSYINQGYRSYLSLPKGQPVIDALMSKKISFLQVAKDILNAIAYLHQHTICHGDLKENNIIFRDGKVCLIDLGHMIACKYYQDMIVMQYVRINPHYNDPEYDPTDINPIETELFSVGVILSRFWQKLTGQNRTSPMFKIEQCVDQKFSNERNLIQALTKFPVKDRSTGEAIYQSFFNEEIAGQINELTVESDQECTDGECQLSNSFERKKVNTEAELTFRQILIFQYDICKGTGQTNRILFLAFHLYRTAYALGLDKINNINHHKIMAFMYVYFANTVYDLGSRHHIKESDITTYLPDLTPSMVVKSLIESFTYVCQMILAETYWDYAKYYEDLPMLLVEMTRTRYTNKWCPRLLNESGRSKDYDKLIELPLSPSNIALPLLDISVSVEPSFYEIDIDQVKSRLERKLKISEIGRFDLSTIIHYRQYLPLMPISMVENFILKATYESKTLTHTDFITALTVIVGYNPQKYNFNYTKLNLHPCSTSLDLLLKIMKSKYL